MAELATAAKTAPTKTVPAKTAPSKTAPAAPGTSAGRTNREIRRLVTIGMTTLVLLVGGGGAWAAIAQLASAVIAPGVVIVESDNKKVQHQTGGIVAAINVRNGDHVAAGDVVMILDDTQLRANQNIVTGRLVEFHAQLARFEAERDGRDEITFPGELEARKNDPAVAKVLAGEETLFSARRTALTGQIDQLRERSGQLDEQIAGLEAQKKAKERELELIADELEGLEALLAKGHVPVTRVIALKRDIARIQGELGSIVSQIAVTKGRITETALQIIQIERDFMEKVAEGIRAAQAEIAPLAEQLVAVDDQLARSLIRAPQAGLVHELAVHTVGGVVGPGETILKIVPNEDALILETRIPTTRVDDVRGGQAATIAFAGLDPRANPMLKGHVRVVSPDLSTDERTGESYYAARVALDEGELARLGGKSIQPGMPAEVFISTGERSVVDYLFAPLLRSARHALREG